MSASPESIAFVMELLEPVAVIEGNRFFGGYGIKSNSTQFAMPVLDRSGELPLYVVNDATRPKYEKLNKQAFSYMTKNGIRWVRRYFEVPEDLLEDQEVLLEWAKESIAVAKASP